MVSDVDVSAFRHGRVPRPVRIRQLLALADSLFAERGFAAASMDELARRAGVSKPVIYELVGSKENLFRSCMTRVAEELGRRVAASVRAETDPLCRLRAGAQSWFKFVSENRGLWTALLGGGDSPVMAEAADIRRRQALVIAGLLAEDADAAGVLASTALLEATAHLVTGAFESVARWASEHPELESAQLAELCVAVLFPGLAGMTRAVPDGWQER